MAGRYRTFKRLWGTRAQFGSMARKAFGVLLTEGPAKLLKYGRHKLRHPYLKFDETDKRLTADLDVDGYQRWIQLCEPPPVPVEPVKQPTVSVLLLWGPAHGEKTFKSLVNQSYRHWEVIVVGRSDSEEDAMSVWESVAQGSGWRYEYVASAGRPWGQELQYALASIQGEWIALVHAGDELAPYAFWNMLAHGGQNPQADLLYSDDDLLDDASNRRVSPFFKPDYSPVMLQHVNYVGHLCLYEADLIRRLFEGNPQEDHLDEHSLTYLAAKAARSVLHIPEILYHARHACGIRLERAELPPVITGVRRAGSTATADGYADRTSIDILIPTRDRLPLLVKCIEGLESTEFRGKVSITILDNGSVDKGTIGYLRKTPHSVISVPGSFNFSRLVNEGVRQTSSEVILLLNNDVEVTNPTWLQTLVEHLSTPAVGVVGPKLLYPDFRVQHAGIILGLGDIAGHAFWLSERCFDGYHGLLKITREVSAVTGACMLTRRSVFQEAGGFREDLPVNFNDIAYCLTVWQKGHSVVYAADTELVHLESASRTPRVYPSERERFIHLFGRRQYDAFYSPHLSRQPAHTYALALDSDKA